MKAKIIKILKQARNIGYSNGEIANEILKVFQSQLEEREFVNLYQDEAGYYISDEFMKTYDEAFNCRDLLSTYIETIAIIRNLKN